MSTRPSWLPPSWRSAWATPALARALDAAGAGSCAQRSTTAFWCEEIGSYAIALDGDKQQCKVPSSNAGHALWSGIASPEHAQRIVDGLMGEAFFSGWGIRTIARRRGALQPDVVPQRLDLAARQRADRRRHGALRPHRRARCSCFSSTVRRQPALRPAPPARAVLRLPPARRRRARPCTRSPARRRPGPRRRCSACCRPASAWRSTRAQAGDRAAHAAPAGVHRLDRISPSRRAGATASTCCCSATSATWASR